MEEQNISETTPKRAAKSRKTTSRKSRKSKSNPLVWVVIAISTLMLAGAFAVFCFHSYRGDAVWVYIPKDATAKDIKEKLTEAMGSGEATA